MRRRNLATSRTLRPPAKSTSTSSNKAISTAFTAIYLAVIFLLLNSILFTIIQSSGVSLSQSIMTEESRLHERIYIGGSGWLKVTSSEVKSMRVNNTGSIAVRIRAIYLEQEFFCDPSAYQDTYINPQESLVIRLDMLPTRIEINQSTIYLSLQAVTERGVKASRLIKTWFTDIGENNPNAITIGPLMLYFDWFFHKEEEGAWEPGWTLTKTNKALTWRILVVNLDVYNRSIVLNKESCFVLMGPEVGGQMNWFIDIPSGQELVLEWSSDPILYFIDYKWSSPNNPQPQAMGGPGEARYMNFLAFIGEFINGSSRTPYGQTIPFEAVRVTDQRPAGSIVVWAMPEFLRCDGISYTLIRARVFDTAGNEMWGVLVNFRTSEGNLSAPSAITDSNGVAAVNLTSATYQTLATVTASRLGVEGTVQVPFTSATRLSLTTNATTIPRKQGSNPGGTALITVQLVDKDNLNVTQAGIVISLAIDWSETSGEPSLGQTLLVTNAQGRASTTLTAGNKAGDATITASAIGLQNGQIVVTVTN